MSSKELINLRKRLLEVKAGIDSQKIVIQALDGLYLVDFRDGTSKPISEAPEDANINIIDVNMEDILVCPGHNEAIIIVDDVSHIEAENIKVLNVIPASRISNKLKF